jgi:hypothetical protein
MIEKTLRQHFVCRDEYWAFAWEKALIGAKAFRH